MLMSSELYLGSFLILSGFTLSLLNLRRLIKNNNTKYFPVLLSENILLMCIGVSFIVKSVYEFKSFNIHMYDVSERRSELAYTSTHEINCNFSSVFMNYGPFILSIVNSFISLIVDNYMHYSMIKEIKKKEDENTVEEFGESARIIKKLKLSYFNILWKKYFPYLAIGIQWIVPILMALSMYPINVTEKTIGTYDKRGFNNFCMTMLDASNYTCDIIEHEPSNSTLELRKYIPSRVDYFEAFDIINDNNGTQIKSVIENVNRIIANIKNGRNFTSFNVTSPLLYRKSKSGENCMRMCLMETKHLISFMVALVIISFFVPVTISTVILTKIHLVDVKKGAAKTYVSRELLYNILFWTPIMFDTMFSLIFCTYSNHEVRTSVFTIVANVYQAMKNFMNTKFFKDNSIVPIE